MELHLVLCIFICDGYTDCKHNIQCKNNSNPGANENGNLIADSNCIQTASVNSTHISPTYE